MCTHPARSNIQCHTDSCPPSLPGVKQWYLPMVSFVFSHCTYCGRILSAPSRSSSLMDADFANVKIHANRFSRGLGHVIQVGKKIHANRFRRGLGHVIQSGKTINLLLSLAHPFGTRCHKGCGIRCLASSVRIGLWSSCQNNCLWSCSALSNIRHSLLILTRHGSK